MSKVLYATEYYRVVQELIWDADRELEREGYSLYNATTGVQEFSSFIYPEMLVWITKLSEDMMTHASSQAVKELEVTH